MTRPLMVVTGGASGIGLGTVEAALAAGYQVATVDVDVAGLAALRARHPGGALVMATLDVTDVAAADRWVSELVAEHGTPQALVNNAGIARGAPLDQLTLEAWNTVLTVDLTSVFVWTQRIGRAMIDARRGSIVSIASIASTTPSPGAGAYSAAKAGVAMLMRQVAIEWGRYGIRANAVSPGFIDTPMNAAAYRDPEARRKRTAIVPLGRLGVAEDIAQVVLYLCSDQARYVSGQNVVVDGGAASSLLGFDGATRGEPPQRRGAARPGGRAAP